MRKGRLKILRPGGTQALGEGNEVERNKVVVRRGE